MDWKKAAELLDLEYEEKFPNCHEYIRFGCSTVTLDGNFTFEKLEFISSLLKKDLGDWKIERL